MINDIPKSLIDAVVRVLTGQPINESTDHPMIEVDGVMKHRHNSLGQPIHHTDEGIKNFHRWFGDSKAVDEHGRPLVVYHGTASDVEHFDPIKAQSEGSAFFFSHSSLMKNKADNANMYAKSRGPKSDANVVPVYLKITNLHKSGFAEDIPSDEAKISPWLDRMDKFNRKHADDKVSYYRQEIKSAIRDNKDGVVFKNIQDVPDNVAGRFVNESDVYAVFHPHQIKSAIGNSGAFSHPTKITESEDYREEHTSPDPESGAPAHNLSSNGVYPEDFYSSKGVQYYGDGRADDKIVHAHLKSLRNRPEADVKIYRAVPNKDEIKDINPGDWVTTNLEYAHDHGEARFSGHKVLTKNVKAKELFTDGNSFHEFGYHPAKQQHTMTDSVRQAYINMTND